jgi:hypothetical protein
VSNEPKRHHHIAEMLQGRFVDPNGNLWFFDKERPEKGVQKTRPGNLFVRGRQYAIKNDDGSYDSQLEHRYSKQETYIDSVIKNIVPVVKAGGYPGLSANERKSLSQFICDQWRRVPQMYENVATDEEFFAEIDSLVSEYETSLGRPLTNQERETVSSRESRMTLRNAIDPNVAIVLTSHGQFDANTLLPVDGVRQINCTLAKSSDVFAGRGQALVKSIAAHVGL